MYNDEYYVKQQAILSELPPPDTGTIDKWKEEAEKLQQLAKTTPVNKDRDPYFLIRKIQLPDLHEKYYGMA